MERMKGIQTIRDGGCGLELTKVPLVPQSSSSSTFTMCPASPGSPVQMMLWCGLKTEQQESRPPRRCLSDLLPLGGLERAGESWAAEAAKWTLPSKATEKRAQEFIDRKRRAALVACHPGGSAALGGFGFVFASLSLSSKLSPTRAASVYTAGTPTLGARRG